MNIIDKTRLLQTSMLTGLMMSLGGMAYAQDAEPIPTAAETIAEDEDDFVAEEDEVVVTGSRLKRNTFTSVSPLQVVDGEVARDLGLVDAQDILSNTSVISGQQNTIGVSTAFNGGLQQAFTTIGNATPNLRALGSSVTGRARTLVLINGRRLGPIGVGGAPANPDVSMIPGTMIERADILLDGASSVYGSDAVGGVINYIMREDFDGVELSATSSMAEHGWGQQHVFSATTGVSNDRGFIGVAAELNFQEEVEQGEVIRDLFGRTQGQLCSTSIGEFIDGTPTPGANFRGDVSGDRVEVCNGIPAGFNITGNFGTVVGTNASGTLDPVPGAPGFFLRPGSFFLPVDDPAIYAFPGTDSYSPEVRRVSFYATGEYDVGGGNEAFFEGMFSSRRLENKSTSQEILPFADDTPFNPFGGGGLLVYSVENGIRQEIDVSRMVAGVRGDLDFLGMNDSWTYEVFGQHHRSNGFQSRTGFLVEDRIVAGLDPDCPTPVGPNFFGFDQNRSPIACVPLNLFTPEFLTTGQFPTQAQNDFAYGVAAVQTEVEQSIAGGFITGDLFKIPTGGMSGIVLGVEARRDQVRTTPSDNLRQGLLQGLDADLGSNGERWIREAFGEVYLPLVEDKPFIKSLTLEGAMRYTDEEFAGSDITYQVKGEWSPNDWLNFKAGYGTSFRAPDTGEQFGTGTVFVSPSRIDPCLVSSLAINPNTNTYDATLDQRTQVVLNNCISLGLDPTTLGTVGQGTPTLAFTSLPVAFGNFGNIATDPETSKAFFAGFSVDQPWFDEVGVRLAFTYYDYIVEGSIGQLTRGQILSECFDSVGLTDPLCAFQVRDPGTGALVSVNEASINLGETTSRGYDVNLRIDYELDQLKLDAPVDLSWDITMTQSLENTEDVLGDGNITDNLGRLRGGGGFPDYSAVSLIRANYKDIGLTWRTRYISDLFGTPDRGNSFDPCFDFNAGALDPNCREAEFTDGYWQNDAFLSYSADTWTVRAGVTNIFDEVQKVDDDLALANVAIASGHDTFGRSFTVGAQKRF